VEAASLVEAAWLDALSTVAAWAMRALMSAGRSENIIVLLVLPIEAYIAMY
jgi:hypothetical protein